ncbi:MAG: lytic transglycosylase domain-containing protein, partial [Pseudomonadota bacterium]
MAKPSAAAAAYIAANRWEVDRICDTIKSAADRNGLPRPFFARLIWKESRFDIKAVSPVGAQGIAQFMPATAKERGLANPFDPAQAIPASAHYLADLKEAFGNWGLAAAAYNGGPDRVSRF